MTDKQDTQGLFTSFKEILNKVQEDVNLGIEIIRLRNKYEGLYKSLKSFYTDLGQKVFELYKEKKDPMPAIREMYEEMQTKEEEMAELKIKISQMEEKTTSKAAAAKKAANSQEIENEENGKEKTSTTKAKGTKSSQKK
jgi:hypothetical protein